MGLFSKQAAEQAKKPRSRLSLTNLLTGGLLVLDPHHPDGHYRGTDTAATADYRWNNPDELRRRLERGEDL